MRARRRKCLFCGDLFRPDPRNVRHQRCCSQPACRRASQAACQQRWLARNPDYFKGPENVARVQAWRAAHPGYARGARRRAGAPLQEDCCVQAVESTGDSAPLMGAALQELLRAQPIVLIGLIAHLTDSALQEDIVRTTRHLLELGHDIMGGGRRGDEHQTRDLPAAAARGAGAVQLDRPPPGA